MVTILVVDDEGPIRELLAELFIDHGYHSLQARNGRHALDVLQAQRPVPVLTDVMMPLLTGAALCRHLKAALGTR